MKSIQVFICNSFLVLISIIMRTVKNNIITYYDRINDICMIVTYQPDVFIFKKKIIKRNQSK
jgi:hypothetical protein